MTNQVRVQFVFGKGRSGSTILGDVLGSVPSVVHAGEVWRLWSSAVIGEHTCSCGESVAKCTVWGEVMERMRHEPIASWSFSNIDEFLELQHRLFTFRGLLSYSVTRESIRTDRDVYSDVMRSLYLSLADVTNSTLIIDSSKWPLDPSLLAPAQGVRPSGVLLVRDPRAVADSWQSRKVFPDTGDDMPVFSEAHTAVSWTSRQMLGEFALRKADGPVELLKYEDFVSRPLATSQRLLDLSGGSYDVSTVFESDRVVNLSAGHTVMGNPSRFADGLTEISAAAIEPKKRPLLDTITWPLRLRYGYSRHGLNGDRG